MAPLALVTQSQAKHLSSPPQSALTITGRELPSFPPAEIYSSLRVTFLYILAPGHLNWDGERHPRRHELDPMEQEVELRFELHEFERDIPPVQLPAERTSCGSREETTTSNQTSCQQAKDDEEGCTSETLISCAIF